MRGVRGLGPMVFLKRLKQFDKMSVLKKMDAKKNAFCFEKKWLNDDRLTTLNQIIFKKC